VKQSMKVLDLGAVGPARARFEDNEKLSTMNPNLVAYLLL
jgi:hypothetical protein